MKIQFASDLHLEFPGNTRFIAAHPLAALGEVLVLCGDIGFLGDVGMMRHPFFQWCSDNFERTLIVPGNHEFYNGFDVGLTLADDGFEQEIASNVCYVNNKSVVLGDTELFLTTLWTTIPPQDHATVNIQLNDCHRIILDKEPLKAHRFGQMHRRCLAWLKEALDKSTAAHKVVATHHCPIVAEDPRYLSNGLTNAFIVPLEDYIEHCGADYWLFGHTHYNAFNGTKIGQTTLLTNQMGYLTHGGEPGFRHDASFEC